MRELKKKPLYHTISNKTGAMPMTTTDDADMPCRISRSQVIGDVATIDNRGKSEAQLLIDGEEVARWDEAGHYSLVWIPK
jgi:hypothetical protein